MGRCLQSMGRPSEALEYLEKAAKLRPDWASTHAALGETYLALGEVDKARESLRRVQAEVLRAKPVGASAIRQLPPDVVTFSGRSRELGLIKGQNQALQADGARVFSAYQAENERLKREVTQQRAAPPSHGPAALYGPGGPQAYKRPEEGSGAPPAPMASAEVKMVNFQTADTGTASRVAKGNTVYTDSINYLPPNSIASAKVIVGVDASAGVNSQSDPLPVVLRVTGPARSVFQNGRLLTTKIEGCLINGAARGDLSSEKVYVKLQKMTCPQPGGRYAVSEVKGFIAFGGKTGVRGRVVSREGGLVTQAFIAGLFGGFGRGFSANANSVFQGTNISTNGKRDKLSTGEILEGGFGEGVAQTGDMVSKYLIERAEQYQPVIEMPTGVDVEIVFLEGVYVRN